VRLEQGKMDRETIFSNLPEEMALRWEQKGAERLHLVDLDGAVQGTAFNKQAIKKVVAAMSIPVQLGGGVRDLETIEQYINLGVESVILGTQAYKEPEFVKAACAKYPGRIMVGIDSRDNYVSVEGWTEATGTSAIDLGKKCGRFGIAAIIYTDIKSDGIKKGPNIAAIREFAQNLDIPVIAAGGIGSIHDIEDVLELEVFGVTGMIIGRALYDGSISLEKAIEVTTKKGSGKKRKNLQISG
jgi:phosphoribosylformimino-5-aminoimidazole carboxamide ribotide isomerase